MFTGVITASGRATIAVPIPLPGTRPAQSKEVAVTVAVGTVAGRQDNARARGRAVSAQVSHRT